MLLQLEVSGEGCSWRPDQQNMMRLLHDQSRCGNRMEDAFDGRHGPGTQFASFHDRGIHPSDPVELNPRPLSRVEEPALFQDANSVFYGKQRGTVSIQLMIADS